MKRRIRHLFSVVATLSLGAGCASLVGIEEHTFSKSDAGGDGGVVVTAQCNEYCDTVMKNCVGTDAVYTTQSTCLGVCAKLPPGSEIEPSGNTVACRLRQARVAGSFEPTANCPGAGPGGAGVCGSNCAAYCSLLEAVCPTEYGALPNCEQACGPLRDTGKFDVVGDHGGDTLQCRLVHVSSATVAPVEHCPHAQLPPSEPWCVDAADAAPDCTEFCRFNLAGCTGDLAVYESTKQCLDVCKKLDIGKNGDRDQNTVGCRRYHTYNALIDPATHCSHTGPGGDGHCGVDAADKTGNCASYCRLASAACGTAFAAKYASTSACEVDCTTQPDAFGAKHDSKYKIAQARSGNTLQCRTLHTAQAFSDPTQCASALGGGDCQ